MDGDLIYLIYVEPVVAVTGPERGGGGGGQWTEPEMRPKMIKLLQCGKSAQYIPFITLSKY